MAAYRLCDKDQFDTDGVLASHIATEGWVAVREATSE
jgi:hypothetical protein